MKLFHIGYDNVLFTRDTSMDGLEIGPEGNQGALEAIFSDDNPGGRFAFVRLTVIPDDDHGGHGEDDDGDCKMFVNVTLAVRARSLEEAERMAAPTDYLDEVVIALLGDYEYDTEAEWDGMDCEEIGAVDEGAMLMQAAGVGAAWPRAAA
jgi:hypothetical protein